MEIVQIIIRAELALLLSMNVYMVLTGCFRLYELLVVLPREKGIEVYQYIYMMIPENIWRIRVHTILLISYVVAEMATAALLLAEPISRVEVTCILILALTVVSLLLLLLMKRYFHYIKILFLQRLWVELKAESAGLMINEERE